MIRPCRCPPPSSAGDAVALSYGVRLFRHPPGWRWDRRPGKDTVKTTNDAGPGRPVGPRLTRAEGTRGGDPRPPGGKGVRAAGAGPAADPEDDRDLVPSPATTPATRSRSRRCLLTLVGWSMRRPQMTPSIVNSPAVVVGRNGPCRCRRSPRVFLDRRDECGVPRKVTVSPTWTSWEER